MRYLHRHLWESKNQKRTTGSATMWHPDRAGGHDLLNSVKYPEQAERRDTIRNGREFTTRTRLSGTFLSTMIPLSDKSTITISLVPQKADIIFIAPVPEVIPPVFTQDMTDVQRLAARKKAIADRDAKIRQYKLTWVDSCLYVAKMTLKSKLPIQMKHPVVRERAMEIGLLKGQTEFSTQILRGMLPHFISLMLQTEEASNGSYASLVYYPSTGKLSK
jgi:hypothetical protein